MYGTSSFTSAGVTSDTGSIPHALAETTRRRSSSRRSSDRATSMPPLSVKTPISRYWRVLSAVSAVISREWSTGKMKFEAWPVDPPGLGSGPLSIRRMSRQPWRARWYARLFPTMPAPMTTARADAGKVPAALTTELIYNGYSSAQQCPVHRTLELVHVPTHELGRPIGFARPDGAKQRGVAPNRLLQPRGLVEREVPDPQRVHVVLLERRLEERIVRPAVDRP